MRPEFSYIFRLSHTNVNMWNGSCFNSFSIEIRLLWFLPILLDFISPCWKYFFLIVSTLSATSERLLSSTITAQIRKWVVHPGLSKSYPNAPNSSIKAYFLLLIYEIFIRKIIIKNFACIFIQWFPLKFVTRFIGWFEPAINQFCDIRYNEFYVLFCHLIPLYC